MAEESDPFEREIVQNCPANGSYYYLVRFNQKKEQIRFPSSQALRIRSPFEHPIDCKPGTWLVIYTSDAAGNVKVQHIGNRPRVQVELQIPDEVCEGAPSAGKTNEELLELIAKQASESDDADPSLRATRIDARKREIALGLASKEQKVLLRGAKNKETIEAYLLNRFHRTELHAQVEAMFRVQSLSAEMMERNFVLAEKAQEAIGRVAEIEKVAAQKIASPPPPPDYTPVLGSVVAAIRDIGVSAMQREDRKQLKPEESAAPVKAALGDKAGDAGALPPAATSTSQDPSPRATTAPDNPTSAVAVKPSAEDRLAQVEAERDRFKAELAAVERGRLRVLDEIQAESAQREDNPRQSASSSRSSSTSSRRPYPSREPGSLFPRGVSRNDRCPCGSGRAYRNCCLYADQVPLSRSSGNSTRTPALRRTARPHLPDASTPPPAEPARPHPTRASTPPPAEPARPHVPDASTPPPAEPARPHVPDASTPPPAEPARPHPTRASTPPPAEPARPHAPDASTPPPAEPARPHPTRASTPPPAEPARPHSADARTPSPSEPARPQSAQPAEPTAPTALLASNGKVAAPSAQTIAEMEGQPLVLPDGALSHGLQELLVNMHAGTLFDDPKAPIPPPLVAQVQQVEAVLVNPPAMDRETARKLLLDGTTVESLGALLFFNPILRTILLKRRGT